MYYLFIIVLLLISLPAFVGIACVLSVFQGFPLFFRQKRIGKDGSIFTLYKFRTMSIHAESMQKKLLLKNEAHGPVFKIHNDPRYTPIGRFLAHTGLDELPQLWNVLRGDMALIGPRPLPIEEAKKLKQWQRKREKIKPGIISPWVLEGYHRMSFDAWMKSDIEYIRKKSFLYDLRLSMYTLKFLVKLFVQELYSSYHSRSK